MSVHPVATPIMRAPQPTVADAVAPTKSAPVSPSPSPSKAPSPAYAVTISAAAKAAASARTPASPSTAATTAARAAVVHAAASMAAPPTTTSGYVMKVRAALARGGDRSVAQIMAALGIPQAAQQQVAAALGTAPKSA